VQVLVVAEAVHYCGTHSTLLHSTAMLSTVTTQLRNTRYRPHSMAVEVAYILTQSDRLVDPITFIAAQYRHCCTKRILEHKLSLEAIACSAS
jgi:hypothetical protein